MDYTGNSATLRRVTDFDDLSVSAGEGGGGVAAGVLLLMAYTGRFRPKGVPFSGFRCIKG